MWAICILLGVLTVAFAPLLISLVVRMLTGYARKYPLLTDVIATITLIIIGAYLLALCGVAAVVYHHIFTGKP